MAKKRSPVNSSGASLEEDSGVDAVEDTVFGDEDLAKLEEGASELADELAATPRKEELPVDVPVVNSPESVLDVVERKLPLVTMEVFAQVSGRKPDQLAGFVRWAKRGKLAARTIPEWQEELTTYENRPV